MKCVIAPASKEFSILTGKTRPIKRVSDETALKLVSEGWAYCPKKLWKDSGRRR